MPTAIAPPVQPENRRLKCLLCAHFTKADGRLCWAHHDQLARLIDPDNHGEPTNDIPASIPALFAMLDPSPGGGATDGRRAPGFHSTPAASPHVIAMRDDRSRNDPRVWFPAGPDGKPDKTRAHTEEENPPRAVRRALRGLVDSLVDETDPVGPRQRNDRFLGASEPLELCMWLHAGVDRLSARDDADELFRDLIELSDQLCRAVGDAPLEPDGWCLALVRDRRRGEFRQCRGPLTMPPPTPDPESDTPEQAQRRIRTVCPRCHRPYTWLDLIRARYEATPSLAPAGA